jgi:hypothetical protein
MTSNLITGKYYRFGKTYSKEGTDDVKELSAFINTNKDNDVTIKDQFELERLLRYNSEWYTIYSNLEKKFTSNEIYQIIHEVVNYIVVNTLIIGKPTFMFALNILENGTPEQKSKFGINDDNIGKYREYMQQLKETDLGDYVRDNNNNWNDTFDYLAIISDRIKEENKNPSNGQSNQSGGKSRRKNRKSQKKRRKSRRSNK